mmetsp:Transcript_18147/g.50785  ORF Transcript_18147/g.50785 Transcript_18147/m.50785 type:complete len:281 (-) Transcript_18147:2452-3294(-)
MRQRPGDVCGLAAPVRLWWQPAPAGQRRSCRGRWRPCWRRMTPTGLAGRGPLQALGRPHARRRPPPPQLQPSAKLLRQSFPPRDRWGGACAPLWQAYAKALVQRLCSHQPAVAASAVKGAPLLPAAGLLWSCSASGRGAAAALMPQLSWWYRASLWPPMRSPPAISSQASWSFALPGQWAALPSLASGHTCSPPPCCQSSHSRRERRLSSLAGAVCTRERCLPCCRAWWAPSRTVPQSTSPWNASSTPTSPRWILSRCNRPELALRQAIAHSQRQPLTEG